MRSSLVRMRSSLVVRASDCQCTSCNGPGFDPSIRRHSGIWGAADETVLNIVQTKRKKSPKKYLKKKKKILNVPSKAFYPNLSWLLGTKMLFTSIYKCWKNKKNKSLPNFLCVTTFWRTFHHDGKMSPGWWGWGVHEHPLSLYLPSRTKLWCTLQLRGKIHSTYFYSTPICTLWWYPIRAKGFSRGLAQQGGPPGWLEESDPAGCDFVRDRRSMAHALTD
jgi:hypothetical protein